MNTIWQRIKEERLRLGMTQVEFGKVGGVLKQTQLHYESGLRRPDTDYLERISAIGADVPYIMLGRRMAESVLPEEVEILKKDEREMLMDYRRSSMDMRRNMRSVIATLAQQSHRGTGDAGGRFQRQEMRNRMGEEHAVAA